MNFMETLFNNPISYKLGIFEVEKIAFTAGSKNEINKDGIWRLCTVIEIEKEADKNIEMMRREINSGSVAQGGDYRSLFY